MGWEILREAARIYDDSSERAGPGWLVPSFLRRLADMKEREAERDAEHETDKQPMSERMEAE